MIGLAIQSIVKSTVNDAVKATTTSSIHDTVSNAAVNKVSQLIEDIGRVGLSATDMDDLDLKTGKVSPDDILSVDLVNQVEASQSLSDYLRGVCPDISQAELNIYDTAGLKPGMVNNRECLTQPNVDLEHKDANGMTNAERMENGLAPINPADNMPYELHHVGQKNDGPLAELTHKEHMSPENNTTLHPVRVGSEVDHGISWGEIRKNHWMARASAA